MCSRKSGPPCTVPEPGPGYPGFKCIQARTRVFKKRQYPTNPNTIVLDPRTFTWVTATTSTRCSRTKAIATVLTPSLFLKHTVKVPTCWPLLNGCLKGKILENWPMWRQLGPQENIASNLMSLSPGETSFKCYTPWTKKNINLSIFCQKVKSCALGCNN